MLMSEPSRFQLLWTDFEMPLMNGCELIRKSVDAGFRGQIVVCASPLITSDMLEMKRLGVRAFLTKPVDFDTLMETLRVCING